MSETHEALGRDLVAAAVLRGDFLLRSGARSSYYIDKYLFTTQPSLLRRLAGELALQLPEGVQRLAGPVLGAVPLYGGRALVEGKPVTGHSRPSVGYVPQLETIDWNFPVTVEVLGALTCSELHEE